MGFGISVNPSVFAAVGAAEAGAGDVPCGVAIVTAVGARVGLEAANKAGWAGGAQVEPIAVAIETILDVFFIYAYLVALGEQTGFIPGGDFHVEEFYVALKIGVLEQGMTKLVQNCPRASDV